MSAGTVTIAQARGRLDDARAGEVRRFLGREAGLNEEAAARWLAELVCVARADREIVGVSSAHPATVSLIGGRRFWLYRSFLAEDTEDARSALFNSTFEVLAEEFAETRQPYIGVCVLVDDPAEIGRRREAVWPDTELMFAGYLDDDRQVRIRYFWGAAIAPGLPSSPSIDVTRKQEYPLEDRYRILRLAETGAPTAEDVLRFWEREGAVPDPAEARRRVAEVTLVAVDRDDGIAGVSSLYLHHNPQLRMPLWHYRTYVAAAHRMSNIAAQLIFTNRDLMEERFVRGEDTRAGGMIFELENEGLKGYFNKALWLPADFTFIGENQKGDHVRIHYFPGAQVPVPGGASLT